MYAWHHCHVLAYPYIIANDSITFQRQLIFDWCNCTSPFAAHDIERIGGHTVHSVIGTIHHKFHTLGNSTKLADDQLIAYEVVEVSDMLLKLVCSVLIIVISIVTNDDTWVLYYILDIT